ncbi:MAG: heme-binding domain-containing protein [Acidimicrobiia bacterium]
MRSFLRLNSRTLIVAFVLIIGLAVTTGATTGISVGISLALLLLVTAVAALLYRWRGGSRLDEPLSRPGMAASMAAAFALVALAIQAVPYGRAHSNPPITAEPSWDSALTRELVVRTCFACHSNEVDYPWYASVAPISWTIQMHVDEGRSEVNYSEWDRRHGEGDDSAESVIEGEMPPRYFTAFGLNDDARLTDSERADLIAGLRATFGEDEESGDEEHGGGDDDDD